MVKKTGGQTLGRGKTGKGTGASVNGTAKTARKGTKRAQKKGAKKPGGAGRLVAEKAFARRSSIHGTGLFARVDVEFGERIIEYHGERITKAEADRRYQKQEKRGKVYIFELNKGVDVDGDIPNNPAKYANHSCDPNAETHVVRGHIWIVAIKPIKAGEEIVYDYNFPYDDWHERPCRCGSKKCRGYIVGEEPFKNLKRRWKRVGKRATIDEDVPAHIARKASGSEDVRRCAARTQDDDPCRFRVHGRARFCGIHRRGR